MPSANLPPPTLSTYVQDSVGPVEIVYACWKVCEAVSIVPLTRSPSTTHCCWPTPRVSHKGRESESRPSQRHRRPRYHRYRRGLRYTATISQQTDGYGHVEPAWPSHLAGLWVGTWVRGDHACRRLPEPIATVTVVLVPNEHPQTICGVEQSLVGRVVSAPRQVAVSGATDT